MVRPSKKQQQHVAVGCILCWGPNKRLSSAACTLTKCHFFPLMYFFSKQEKGNISGHDMSQIQTHSRIPFMPARWSNHDNEAETLRVIRKSRDAGQEPGERRSSSMKRRLVCHVCVQPRLKCVLFLFCFFLILYTRDNVVTVARVHKSARRMCLF